MPYWTYEKHDDEHYAVFTMNRPDRLNAFGRQMIAERREAMADFNADPNMWVAIVTGTGRAFSAGADLKEMAQRNQDGDGDSSTDRAGAADEPRGPGILSRSPKPIIAAVNGLALGGGMEEAMDCDIRIASTEATFGLPEVKRGILAIYGIHHFARVTHFGEAMYYALTGETMSAEEARRIGFVHEVVPPERLMPRAIEIAQAIAANAPLAVQATRKMMHFWRRLAMEESQKFGDVIYAQINQSEDAKEGPLAFTEKRPPQWKGR